MQVVLVMFRGGGERRSFSITRDVTVIGRREDCDFRIPLGEISRKHCRLIKDGDTLRVEDLGSSNGTHVNGTRVQESELAPGDTLKVGSVVFVVQVDGVPSDDELHPAPAAAGPEADTKTAHQQPADEEQLEEAAAYEEVTQGGAAVEESAFTPDEATMDEVLASSETPQAASADGVLGLEDAPEEDPHEDHAPIADAAAEGDYDPMAILSADPESSSLGASIEDSGIAEDLIIELEQQQHHGPSHQA